MRIMSFNQEWDKLEDTVFTTFRYPRIDKDWYVGEEVQIYLKARSKNRRRLGTAVIIGKEKRDLNPCFGDKFTIASDKEAQDDDFTNRQDMANYMRKQYGLAYISLFNKLTLVWEEKHD